MSKRKQASRKAIYNLYNDDILDVGLTQGIYPDNAIVKITKEHLEKCEYLQFWDDPEKILEITPGRRKALLENPLSKSKDDIVMLLGIEGKIVMGRMYLYLGKIRINGKTSDCIVKASIIVPEKFRRTMFGIRLLVATEKLNIPTIVSGVSQIALPIARQINQKEIKASRVIFMYRSYSAVSHYLKKGLHSWIISKLVDMVFALLRCLFAVKYRGFSIKRLSSVPDEWGPLIEKHLPEYGMYNSREYLDWLAHNTFNDNPGSGNVLAGIYKNGTPAGFVLIKYRYYPFVSQKKFENLHFATLTHWQSWNKDISCYHLFNAALKILRKEGIDAMEICTAPEITKKLRIWGGMPSGTLSTFISNIPQEMLDQEWNFPSATGDGHLN